MIGEFKGGRRSPIGGQRSYLKLLFRYSRLIPAGTGMTRYRKVEMEVTEEMRPRREDELIADMEMVEEKLAES